MDNFRLDSLICALCCFETVYLVNISEDILSEFISHPSIKVRNFRSKQQGLRFIRSLASTMTNKYLRSKESLHENILWMFPMISRSLALHMLKNGNPIRDAHFSYDPYPSMNSYMFKTLLDMPTMAYNTHKIANKTKKPPVHCRSESILTYIPGVTKVRAPA